MSDAARFLTAFSQALQSCLIVWGRIENGKMILEPAFEVVTRPSLPARGGDYSVEGRAADGSRIFSLPFTPDEIGTALCRLAREGIVRNAEVGRNERRQPVFGLVVAEDKLTSENVFG